MSIVTTHRHEAHVGPTIHHAAPPRPLHAKRIHTHRVYEIKRPRAHSRHLFTLGPRRTHASLCSTAGKRRARAGERHSAVNLEVPRTCLAGDLCRWIRWRSFSPAPRRASACHHGRVMQFWFRIAPPGKLTELDRRGRHRRPPVRQPAIDNQTNYCWGAASASGAPEAAAPPTPLLQVVKMCLVGVWHGEGG